MNRSFSTLAAIAAVVQLGTTSLQARNLTIEERIRAQEVIERVYYSHQVGATRPFEEAVPREVLERKVRTYLKQTVALETLWKTPVTAEMLHRELERMAAGTRMPERLRQLYAALGDDPLLIQECLARPLLVDRLARNFFAYDGTTHAAARRRTERLRQDLSQGRVDPASDHPARSVTEIVRMEEGSRGVIAGRPDMIPGGRRETPRLVLSEEEFDTYSRRLPQEVGEIGPLVEESEAFLVQVALEKSEGRLRIARFTVPKVPWEEWWDSVDDRLDEGSVSEAVPTTGLLPMPRADTAGGLSPASCLADDTWEGVSLLKAPDGRNGHVALWTGSLMIVWGGSNTTYLYTGGRYDPATDTWTPMSTLNAPRARGAVWTGSQMIAWGGYIDGYLNTGGRYDPVSDTWTPTSTVGAPAGRGSYTLVWTGSRMIVWGGYDGAYLNTGGRYDPVSDTWTATSTSGAPAGRSSHSAVWTGSRMVVWGGADPIELNTGGRYDPATDTWMATSTTDSPSARRNHTAVWTGNEMVVWGGVNGGTFVYTGGRYDPSTDSWTPTSTIGAPAPNTSHTAVWTGTRMIVWSGSAPLVPPPSGRYDPVSDTWTAVATNNSPSGRYGHSAVWTGTLMIIWGGFDFNTNKYANTGGRYDSESDTWTPTVISNAPAPRYFHTSVWTGSLMVVWGGYDGSVLRSGGRYDPATDAWRPTTIMGPPTAPSARQSHTAVWAGGYMVVWGGYTTFGSDLGTGRRYNPLTDTWAPVSTSGSPTPRFAHTAVSTGTQMIVWGGWAGVLGIQNTGGRYDPATDTWAPISTIDAPLPRYWHTAVWTGSRMIVWGGTDALEVFSTGGLYNPATDSWAATSTVNAPSIRYAHTGVWTGSRMVIWGGNNLINTSSTSSLDTGGRYDPITDEWSPTSTTGAPAPRHWHSAVSTGSVMVVWGGLVQSGDVVDTGGRYNPGTDVWASTSATGAPSPRVYHSAVWTGSFMIVWGGTTLNQPSFDTGGRYALGHSMDDDGDGFSECAGDCNDAHAGILPGAVEVCDGLDNDCDGVVDDAAPPAGTPLLMVDATPAGATLLTWTPVGEATAYDSARGDLSILRSSGGDFSAAVQACLANNLGGLSLQVADMPAMGTGFWYLFRAVNCGGPGTYDSGGTGQVGSRDPGLDTSPLACP